MIRWGTLDVFSKRLKVFKKIFYGFLSMILAFSIVFTDVVNILISEIPFIDSSRHSILGTNNVYAATGDFSIFRESSGTQTVSSSTLDVPWDTTVSASTDISLQPNGSDINLFEGGKYLVMYNVWSEQGTSTAGGLRRSQETWLTLQGDPLPGGRGGGYIRDTLGLVQMYNSGSAIVDAVAGEDLQVHVRRDDANEAAGVNIRPNTNGISVLKMKDDWDYLMVHKNATSSNIHPNTSFTDLTWDTADEVDVGSFAFTPTSGDITLKGDNNDHFLVIASARLEKNNDNNRENYEMILTLDGNEIPGTRVSAYMRGNNNGNNDFNEVLVYNGIIKKDVVGDQTLNVEIRRESIGGAGPTVVMGGQAALSIAALPDEGSYVMLTDTSDTLQATTQTGFGWNSQIEVDSAAFSHSTVSNSSQININQAGDYLFFSTMYATTTASGDRQTQRIDWLKTGSPLNYGSHGQYNRDDSTTRSSGSSGGLIINSLTDSDYIEVTHYDEVDPPTSLTFQANRVAVQGVLLDQNFWGTDVLVSSQGAQSIEADVPTSNFYTGGKFVIEERSGARNVTNVTITESGTVDAANGLENIKLYYDLDTTLPYDCASESYSGGEAQFGSTDINGFSGADGSSSFIDVVSISTTQSLCLYTVLDVTSSSSDADTIELSIDNPTTDVVVTGGASIGPILTVDVSGSTTLRNAKLTQVHYHWLNDDGSEGSATSIEGLEDVPTSGFANGATRRLRTQISAAGSTSSEPVTLRLEYAQKTADCSLMSSWIDVGAVGGDWDMSDTAFFASDGLNSTDLSVASGGTTNANTTHLSPNGALRDTSSELSALVFNSNNFLEAEFAIEPTVTAPQGNTYCFRLTDAGTPLRNYAIYPEGTISADVDVSASSTQISTLNVNSVSEYVGGTFVIERPGTSRTLTDITITETGTIDAQNDIGNIKIYYDLDNSLPYDCTGETYDAGLDAQWGVTDVDGFSATNGSSTFTGTPSATISSTQTFCGYVVFDIGSGASDGETINIEISDPSSDVVVTGSSVGPSTAVSPTGNTTVTGPILTQTHYHWRNDDGNETDATSASEGIEDSPILDVPKESIRRLRLQVSNEGLVDASAASFRLEYGTKVSSCTNIMTWIDVGASGGAWDMALSSNIADGNTTDVSPSNVGEMTNENLTFDGVGALRETASDSGAITLTSSEFTELEYSIQATADSGYDTSYCFRVSDAGAELPSYHNYAELTTREKQDFYIQRGTEVVLGTSTTLVAGLDYDMPSSTTTAFVRISDSHMTGAGDDVGTNGQQADDVTAYISDQSDITSSFTISRPPTATSNTRVDWEIIEFVGLPGTDNEMTVRRVGELSFSVNDFIKSGPTTAVNENNDVVVFITGQQNQNAGTSEYNDGLFTAEWNTTTSQPDLERGDADVIADVSYAVVEFKGANWKIQRIEHTYSLSGVTETESMNPIGLIPRAFVHAQKRVGEGLRSIDEGGHLVFISSIGAVSFALNSTAETPSGHVSVAWVIENTQTGSGAMNTYQSFGSFVNPDPEPALYSIPIGGTVNPSNASIFGNNHTDGTGTTYPRLHTGFTIASSTHYEIYRSDTNNDMDFRVEVVEWPIAETSVRQNYYRFYVDNETITPTDPWPVGAENLGENMTLTEADDPLGEGERLRIRMSLKINNATLPENTKAFKLQYGLQVTTCSAINVWTDVGAPGSGTIWRGYNGAPVDGTEIATGTPAQGTLLLTPSVVAGTYEEQNDSAINPYLVNIGDDIEYDWVIQHNGAAQRSDYCFRVVNSDDSEIDSYINYPTVRTTGYTPIIDNWRWYDDEANITPVNALAAENVAPIDIANQNIIKLRVSAAEAENAAGANIKFALQYSQYADFSDGGTILVSTSSCTESSLWCYADAGGDDNSLISSATLTGTDSCVAGVGAGCGTHNEAATTSSSFMHEAAATTEFEFTIKHAGARASGVYYFRLYDINSDQPLIARSSYPSLVTEGPQLVSTLSSVSSGTSVAGIVTDVSTTPTSVGFGSVPINTSYEAAQRIAINTNATEGYQLLVYATQQLSNSYGDSIPSINSTNAVPLSWSTACSGTATGCFGYHTTDSTLKGGSVRFAPLDSYAALDTTAREIMYSSVPANDTHDIVYRMYVTELQPAGDYETSIVYISVPVH